MLALPFLPTSPVELTEKPSRAAALTHRQRYIFLGLSKAEAIILPEIAAPSAFRMKAHSPLTATSQIARASRSFEQM